MKSERKVTSFRLSILATRQLAELTAKLRMNNSEIVSTAIDRMYQQETQTMTRTIEATFKRSDLPEWAQNDSDIYERCLSDLAFRAAVFDAETPQRRRQLQKESHRFMEELRNRALDAQPAA